MRAGWWWIDRWRKSTAYTDMTLAEQGAYRNLLDELWLREGALPKSERILAKISGDPFGWHEVRAVVMARFYETADGWRNKTHDEVMDGSFRHLQSQREKGRKRAESAQRGPGGTFQPNQPGTSRDTSRSTSRATSLPSPSPSLSPEQSPKEKQPCADKSARAKYSEGFERWWEAYAHRQNRGSKSKAFGHWQRKKLEGMADELVAMLPRFAATKEWREGFQPLAVTFLSGDLWESPPQPERDNGRPREVADTPPGHAAYGREPGEWQDNGFTHRLTREFLYARRPEGGSFPNDWEKLSRRKA